MKRPVATAIALSLAGLALAAAAPMAVAAPGAETPSALPHLWYSAPTDEPPTPDPDHPVMRATASGPSAKTEPATINVTGVHPGDRLEAQVSPAVGGGDGTGWVFETGGPNGTAVISLTAPTGGWKAQTRYSWFVRDIDHGLVNQGHFTTPAWPGEAPGAVFDAQVQLPTTPKGAIVFTITNAKPGSEVKVVLGVNGQPYLGGPAASGVADAKGRAVLKVLPEGPGWSSNTRHIWEATSEGLTAHGSFTIPDWRAVTPGPVTPAPTQPAPPAPPKDSDGGLAKTGF